VWMIYSSLVTVCFCFTALCVVESVITKAAGVVGGQVTIQCSYGTCSGKDILVETKGIKNASQDRYSIEDKGDVFYVTIKDLRKPHVSTTLTNLSTTSPYTSTTLPNLSTTSPYTSTTLPNLSTTSPYTSTTLPNLSTTSPYTSTTLPNLSTTSPYTSTTLPNLTTSSNLSTTFLETSVVVYQEQV
uniref:Immunoglobulin V-set domain-containing protein n=1 Tax=Salmo trutta TaxID=8032 RepID=A0A674DDG6_SALTR